MKAYEKLKKMQNEHELGFNLALITFQQWGLDKAKKITDEQIEKAKAPLMADEFARLLFKYIRELAKIEEEETMAIYKYIELEKPFDTKGFKPRKR